MGPIEADLDGVDEDVVNVAATLGIDDIEAADAGDDIAGNAGDDIAGDDDEMAGYFKSSSSTSVPNSKGKGAFGQNLLSKGSVNLICFRCSTACVKLFFLRNVPGLYL